MQERDKEKSERVQVLGRLGLGVLEGPGMETKPQAPLFLWLLGSSTQAHFSLERRSCQKHRRAAGDKGARGRAAEQCCREQ